VLADRDEHDRAGAGERRVQRHEEEEDPRGRGRSKGAGADEQRLQQPLAALRAAPAAHVERSRKDCRHEEARRVQRQAEHRRVEEQQQSADRRPDHDDDVLERREEGVRGGQGLLLHDLRGQGARGRPIRCVRQRGDHLQEDEEQDGRRDGDHDRLRDGDDARRGRRHGHHAAPVVPVGDQAAEGCDDHAGDPLGGADRGEQRERLGPLEHHHGEDDARSPPADRVDQERRHEEPVVAVA